MSLDDQPTTATPATTEQVPAHGPVPRPDVAPAPAPIVDFRRAGRRVRASALVLGSLALAGWLVSGVVADGPDVSDLGAWAGLALLGMFLVEVVVVGGSALRGMLAAGDRGERLAGGDVGLLPPQLTGRSGPDR